MNRQQWICAAAAVFGLLGSDDSLAAQRPKNGGRQGRFFPAIIALSPDSAIAGQSGCTLTVNGANFGAGTVLFFDANARPTTVISSSQLTANLPAGDFAGAGVFSIIVSNAHKKTATASFLVNKADTSTVLTTSANPSLPGDAVIFNAIVSITAPGSGMPTGDVIFEDGKIPVATNHLSNGQAAFRTSTLSAGVHWITATYAGDASRNPSTNAPLTQLVGDSFTRIYSVTSLNSSTNAVVFGQSVTFTAAIESVAPGAGPPSGTVSFKEGETTLGTRSVIAGRAVFTTASLPVGAHSISAAYHGDDYFQTSTSAALVQTVGKCGSTVGVASSANASVSGQSVTFTATVSAIAPGSGTPSGLVTFRDGATVLGTGTLSGGQATWTSSALGVGPHSITASYSGDLSFIAGASLALAQAVYKASSTTALASSLNPAVVGQPVTFWADVSAVAPGSGMPTGTVTFKDGGVPLGTTSLNSGRANWTSSSLSRAIHSITAVYNGDGNFNPSTSAVLAQTINSGKPTPSGIAIAQSTSLQQTAATLPVIISMTLLLDGNTGLVISTSPGQNCLVQASTDSLTWTTLGTNAADMIGIISFVDTQSTNYPSRSYRVGSL